MKALTASWSGLRKGGEEMGKKEEFIVGLDIGTTKICAIVGFPSAKTLDIIGIGTHPSHGLRKGVVVNIESTVQSSKGAGEEAELMAGCEITSVYTGIAGGHIKGFNSHGIVGVKSHEVSEADGRRVVESARAIATPMNRAGLEVHDIILQQLASSEAALTAEEKELGVALVDIGGGTTDIAIFHQGSIKHTSVISLAGDHVTGDIAIGLTTPLEAAGEIKKKNGLARPALLGKE